MKNNEYLEKYKQEIKKYKSSLNYDYKKNREKLLINKQMENWIKDKKLDFTQAIVLMFNLENEKYIIEVPTCDANDIIRTNEDGINVTISRKKKIVDNLPYIINDDSNFKLNWWNLASLYDNDILENADLQQITKLYPNISQNHLLKLTMYLKNTEMFEAYMNILKNESPQIIDLILEYITPISFYYFAQDEYYEYPLFDVSIGPGYPISIKDNYYRTFYDYIFYDKIDTCYEKGIESIYYKYLNRLTEKDKNKNFCWKNNFYFAKEYENFFINQFYMLKTILNFENKEELLVKLNNLKSYLLEKVPKPIDKSRREETPYEETTISYESSEDEWLSINPIYKTVLKTNIKNITEVDFGQKQITELMEEFNEMTRILLNNDIDTDAYNVLNKIYSISSLEMYKILLELDIEKPKVKKYINK